LEENKVIKVRVSSFVIKWGDKQEVLVSKPKKEKRKKNRSATSKCYQNGSEYNFFEISNMPEYV
jgi:hypothetical protein